MLAVIGVAIGFTDPFGGAGGPARSGTSVADPTALSLVERGTLSSQTQVDATLGYTGSYSVSIPSGTSTAALGQARASAQAAEEKVATDQQSLAAARKVAKSENAATVTGALATVHSDETALSAASAQLAADRHASCPAATSSTVTTPVGSSGGGSSGGSSSGGSSSGGDPPASPAGTRSPTTTTGTTSGTTTSATSVSGSVNPNGAETSYSFEYGTTTSFGSQTPSQRIGSGTSPVSVSANLTGLRPGTTYLFALVATNANGTSTGPTQSFQTAASSCVEQAQVVASDGAGLTVAKDTLASDRAGGSDSVRQAEATLAADEASATTDEQALSLAESATATNPGSILTEVPKVGTLVHRGQAVYGIAGHPVPLLYGPVTPWRALGPGASPGADVAELNANLAALGFEKGASSGAQFSAATEAAVRAWQASLKAPVTGAVALGDDVVAPGPIEVSSVSASVGQAVQPGAAVLQATSLTPEVVVALDAAQQSEVRVGDHVTITLPDNATTPGAVTSVGTVATCPPGSSASGTSSSGGPSGCTSSSGSSATPTVTVDIALDRPAAAGHLDQAPVEVAITTATAHDALIVPTDALVARSGGAYALDVVGAHGHHLVGVTLGLFDDADGLVQVSGDLHAGERVVVPKL